MATVPSKADILYQKQHIYDNRGPAIIASHVICFSLASIAVVLRFVSRKIARVKYEADDWLTVGGLVLTLGVMICNLVAVKYGLGKHEILLTNPKGLAQAIISAEFIYNFALMCIKSSILYLYYRVFFVSRSFTISLWVIFGFVFGYSVAQAFGSVFQCVPLSAVWDPKQLPGATCIDAPLGSTIVGAFNVATDFALLLLPMPMLWKMQMNLKRKFQIMAMFLLGGFVTFASIFRAIVIQYSSLTYRPADLTMLTFPATQSFSDMSYADAQTDEWTLVELGMAIVSACLPTYRPLFSKVFRRFGSTSEEGEQKTIMHLASDPSLSLQQTRSSPSQPVNFTHFGVLGDANDLEAGTKRVGGF